MTWSRSGPPANTASACPSPSSSGSTSPGATSGRGAVPLALCALLLLGGCAPGASGDSGPPVSPTGKEYPPGTPPEESRFSQTAGVYLRSADYRRALEIAREGIEADPENPVHHFLAGRAAVRLGEHEEADEHFSEAERIYPAYEIEIEPERESAWRESFNEGIEAYGDGDHERALEAWRNAAVIYDLRPDAHRNLGSLLAGAGRRDEAIEVYRGLIDGMEREPATRVLAEEERDQRTEARRQAEERLSGLLLSEGRFAEAEPLLRARLEREPDDVELQSDLATALQGQGEEEEAAAIYASLLSHEGVEASQLSSLGVALFRTEDYGKAAEAFERLTDLRPRSRDAWFNYANTLFAAEEWDALLPVVERLVEVDPLNETVGMLQGRARLEAGDEEGARAALARVDEAPVHVDGISMESAPAAGSGQGGTLLQGRVVGNAAEPGERVRLRFVFYSGDRQVGYETLTVEAPEPGRADLFELTFQGDAEAYRYEPVP